MIKHKLLLEKLLTKLTPVFSNLTFSWILMNIRSGDNSIPKPRVAFCFHSKIYRKNLKEHTVFLCTNSLHA